MKATISKSIGNSYVIKVNGAFYDIKTMKQACGILKMDNVTSELNKFLSKNHHEEIDIKERKPKDKISQYDNIINWIDKRRSVSDIVENFKLSSRLIKICAFKRSPFGGFLELDTPNISYYLVFGKYELLVHKNVFHNEIGDVDIVEIRAL